MISTKAIIKAMKVGIKYSDLHGYKWTADKNGLHWSYGVDFDIIRKQSLTGCIYILKDRQCGFRCYVATDVAYWLSDNTYFFPLYDDFHAVIVLTQRLIKLANMVY